ncbi:MAG: hypothetical protein HN348_34920, partial [Proteobacteria bacterium]|nr:hypothetical protein [Pseudomonadota bacterium]
ALTSFDMTSLSEIVCASIYVQDNLLLEDLDGLAGLNYIWYELYIVDNDALTNLDGLLNVLLVGADFYIEGNAGITDADATDLYNTIGEDNVYGTVTITNNG